MRPPISSTWRSFTSNNFARQLRTVFRVSTHKSPLVDVATREKNMFPPKFKTSTPIRHFVGFILIGAFLQVAAQSSRVAAQDAPVQSKVIEADLNLEGIQFVGPFGTEDEKNPKQDTFTFRDGKFATGSCLEWGFSPAPYWTRSDSQGVHFLAELESPEHGTMRYEGVFDGSELTVVGYWRKERWYWTIERTYRGTGRPAKSSN